jgi:translation initiation factor 6 (eIF-6)
MPSHTADNLIPDFEPENVQEQIDEILKTQNREQLLTLVRDQITKAFIYGIQSDQHSKGYLRAHGLPEDEIGYLKQKRL